MWLLTVGAGHPLADPLDVGKSDAPSPPWPRQAGSAQGSCSIVWREHGVPETPGAVLKTTEALETFSMLAVGLPACHTLSTDLGTPFPPSPHGAAQVMTLKEEAGNPGRCADKATSGLCASRRGQGPELGVRAGAQAQEKRVGCEPSCCVLVVLLVCRIVSCVSV